MSPEPSPPPVASLPRRRRLPLAVLGLVALLAAFGWGVIHLFELRFAGGDVYPAYSTLRKDPLGAAAFYDALETLPGLSVTRNLRPLASLAQSAQRLLRPRSAMVRATPGSDIGNPSGPLVCFYLGADAYAWPHLFRHADFERLDTIMRQGGRVVLTFLPGQTPLTEKDLERSRRGSSDEGDSPSNSPSRPKAIPASPVDATPASPPTGKNDPAESPPTPAKRPLPVGLRWVDLVERWGIDFRRVDKAHAKVLHRAPLASGTIISAPSTSRRGNPDSAQPVADGPLTGAGQVSWHSILDFDLDTAVARTAGWQVWYQRGSRPVIVGRPVGDKGGELILASDSYFVSNEALSAEARPALLAGLVGPARRVIFDETHLGIAEQLGMMTLARRYGLQGGLAALGLLAALFVWRNVVSLAPPRIPLAGRSAAATTVVGRDAAAGFLNLLRRGVSSRDLIDVCLAQWQQAPGPRAPDAGEVARLRTVAAGEAARPASLRSPATAYRALCAALHVRHRG